MFSGHARFPVVELIQPRQIVLEGPSVRLYLAHHLADAPALVLVFGVRRALEVLDEIRVQLREGMRQAEGKWSVDAAGG